MKYTCFMAILLLGACSGSKENQGLSDHLQQLSYETRSLYINLQKVAENGFMFGHQDDLAYGIGWKGGEFDSDVEKVSGDYPAVFGWDIGHIDSTRNLDSVPFTKMTEWIIEAYSRGAVNTISWHERNLASGGDSWDASRVVDQMLEGGKLNKRFNDQLDSVAKFLNGLETNEGVKVPVIFRPFHEHNGHWFWWGSKSCSDEEYKQLWRYTADYLKNTKKIKHILLCYSTDAFEDSLDYMARYPGDDYVDILGFDDYQSVRSYESSSELSTRMCIVNTIAKQKNKVAALSETGLEKIPIDDWWTNVLLSAYKGCNDHDRIAYVLVWRNARKSHHYAPYPGHGSSSDFIKFKEDRSTLFMEDLPEMYKGDL